MPKLAGSMWVSGSNLHFVDKNGAEWYFTGDLMATSGGTAGSIWVEGNYVMYMSAEAYKRRLPMAALEAQASAQAGSIWIETAHSPADSFVFIAGGNRRYARTYVPAVAHTNVAHVNTDPGHTNTHTNTDPPHTNSDPGHTNTFVDTDPGHTNEGHSDTPHEDIPAEHADAAHYDIPEHDDMSGHTNTDPGHTNTGHSDDPPHTNSDPGHTNTGHSDDPPHTNTAHTNIAGSAHQDQPFYVGP